MGQAGLILEAGSARWKNFKKNEDYLFCILE